MSIPAISPDPAATIHARGLTRRFGAHEAVKNIDLELRRGEVLGFLGPNGAGKTTTMQMLTGNLAPTEGEITICGVDILARPTAAKARIGYLPENPPLYRELTVDEYLQLAVKLHRVPKAERREAIARAKTRCGLTDVGRKLIGTLSKGYQQRVGIAQAIAHEPDVVILDEPTVGLDPNQIRDIRALIRELGGTHSVILSTHILPEVEAICDRVQILHHGSVVYSDTIAALKAFHSGRTVLLGLRRPPPDAELAAVPGVTAVEHLGELYRLQLSADRDPTEQLVARSVESNWGLYHLAPAQTSLEDVFVNLTR
ncbi:MAG TPA: ABC transporter ATP-binding protein [Burkholderiales bacterium]|jgi:ABC-2 type transport system ATP-binding protein|nr:ABC transporter ATP-binding protein [Burkholderiales bacterium]